MIDSARRWLRDQMAHDGRLRALLMSNRAYAIMAFIVVLTGWMSGLYW